MFSVSLSSIVKFLVGILLLQGATGLLVYTALQTDWTKTWPLFAALVVTFGTLTALWFNAVADGSRKQAVAKVRESFSKEREKIRVRAEQEKSKTARDTQRKVTRDQQRSQTSSHIKTGVMIGGAASVGLVLLMTQMVTLGLLTLTTAGGAALGYGVRARQDRLAQGARTLIRGGRPPEKEVQVIEARPALRAVPAPRRKEAGNQTDA